MGERACGRGRLAPIGASAPSSTGPGSRIMACRAAAASREDHSPSPARASAVSKSLRVDHIGCLSWGRCVHHAEILPRSGGSLAELPLLARLRNFSHLPKSVWSLGYCRLAFLTLSSSRFDPQRRFLGLFFSLPLNIRQADT